MSYAARDSPASMMGSGSRGDHRLPRRSSLDASWLPVPRQWLVTNALILGVVWTTVFRYSDKGLVFLWLEALGLAITAFCFFVSTFFSR